MHSHMRSHGNAEECAEIVQGLLCKQSGLVLHVTFSATRTLNITGPNKIAQMSLRQMRVN